MPTYRTGDMWSAFDEADHFLITTNAITRRDGALVMGRGIAQQARDRFPGLDLKAGAAVRNSATNGFYGVILGRKIGLFQVKHHWKEQARLDFIQASTQMLSDFAQEHPNRTYHLNFPGIGNGGLPYDSVAPLLSMLPDNVHVWTYQ